MEKENRGFFNSPVIQKNTPIKRLGLSRKRKSCGSESSLNAKIQACNEKFVDRPVRSENFILDEEMQNTTRNSEEEDNCQTINYDAEIDLLNKKISEKEGKLKSLQCNKDKVKELEDLIELWRNGCKNAFSCFIQLLKERRQENIDWKGVLNQLGIWQTILENFESVSEMFES